MLDVNERVEEEGGGWNVGSATLGYNENKWKNNKQ
jgi:hypothetical protein